MLLQTAKRIDFKAGVVRVPYTTLYIHTIAVQCCSAAVQCSASIERYSIVLQVETLRAHHGMLVDSDISKHSIARSITSLLATGAIIIINYLLFIIMKSVAGEAALFGPLELDQLAVQFEYLTALDGSPGLLTLSRYPQNARLLLCNIINSM